MPADVSGCTIVLPPNACHPASGLTPPLGGYSTLGVAFTINRATIPKGKCAGYQFCYRAAGDPAAPWQCRTGRVKRPATDDVLIDWNPSGDRLPVGVGLRTIVLTNSGSSALQMDVLLVHSGGLEFSLTGEFNDDPSGDGMPAPDYSSMTLRLALAPGKATPVTFRSRGLQGTLPGRKKATGWTDLSLIRLCYPEPLDSIGAGEDPLLLGSTRVLHVESSDMTTPPADGAAYAYGPTTAEGQWLSLETNPGETLEPQACTDLANFLPDRVSPYGAVQGPEGSILGDGSQLWMHRPSPAGVAMKRGFHLVQRHPLTSLPGNFGGNGRWVNRISKRQCPNGSDPYVAGDGGVRCWVPHD